MTKGPLISVGMSARDNETTIATAINSLLKQTYSNWELLLVDDGSRDSTLHVASRYPDERITVIADRANLGLAARLNQAISRAHGEYFARLDADDIAYPERFEKQLATLTADRRIDLLGTAAVVFRGDGEAVGLLPCGATSHEQICLKPWRGFMNLWHPTWMGKLSWFARYRYDPRLRKSQDRDILLRSYKSSRFSCLPEALVGYRQQSLELGKILKTRAYFSRILGSAAIQHHDPRYVWGIAEQCAKAATDVVAVTTGLYYRLLRHRATPLTGRSEEEWRQVWVSVRG